MRPTRVLVVEDDEPLRQALCDSVRRLGYDVWEAGDSASALALLDEQESCPVDLVLSDLFMPGVPGTVLADTARKRWSNLKILLMSGDATTDLSEPYPLLCKPFRRVDLVRALTDLIGHTAEQTGAR